jgi:hypothetical protein
MWGVAADLILCYHISIGKYSEGAYPVTLLRDHTISGTKIQGDEFLDLCDTQGILTDGHMEDPDAENSTLIEAAVTSLNTEREKAESPLRWFYYEGNLHLVPTHIARRIGEMRKEINQWLDAQA